MTIQQLEYVVALDTHRHFVRAAESCGVSQSTLSMLVKKLEEELDTVIFDRDSHPVRPTQIGERIIAQARVVLYNAGQLTEIAASERKTVNGDIRLAIIPTVASDIIPRLLETMRRDSPSIRLHTLEMQICDIIERLQRAEIDMAIMATPLHRETLLEIPMYYEKFLAYVSPREELYKKSEIRSSDMPVEHLWALKEGNCLRDQVFRFCSDCSGYTAGYEAGSIDTLVRIVDENGGYTVIPELHVEYLSERQGKSLRSLVDPDVVREISLVVRHDYVREGLVNEVVGAVKKIIPERMLDGRLKKFAITL